MSPDIVAFFDATTSTYSYVVSDPSSKRCAIIDPVLDYDPAAGRISLDNAARLIAHVQEQGLTVDWLLETHVHADHLSAATHLKHRLGGRLAIGERVTLVQETFAKLFNTGSEFATDGRQFDRLFRDGDSFSIGAIAARGLHTPGHTQTCMTYLIGDAAFVGDTLFMPDYGTARCDFPGGDARSLYRSIRRLFELPGETRLSLCHADKAPGRDHYRYQTTVAEQRADNVHVRDGIDEETFVAMRRARDAELHVPALILPAVQVNMRGGALPPAEGNGRRYLKIPVDVL
jgi:glyoxylase-like metal-dependent hydrolase (beta-lactamase superfamily II)